MIESALTRHCFREPVSELYDAARYLDAAVSAHLSGQHLLSQELIRLANNPRILAWTDSIWRKNSPYVKVSKSVVSTKSLPKEPERMPTSSQKCELHNRDGYDCRFCNLPIIRPEVRRKISSAYPNALPWGKTNHSQHAAFQAMWAQYDHIVPHSRGGTNNLDNLVVTRAACNFGRMSYTLEEVGLSDPRLRAPAQSLWDGLERFK